MQLDRYLFREVSKARTDQIKCSLLVCNLFLRVSGDKRSSGGDVQRHSLSQDGFKELKIKILLGNLLHPSRPSFHTIINRAASRGRHPFEKFLIDAVHTCGARPCVPSAPNCVTKLDDFPTINSEQVVG